MGISYIALFSVLAVGIIGLTLFIWMKKGKSKIKIKQNKPKIKISRIGLYFIISILLMASLSFLILLKLLLPEMLYRSLQVILLIFGLIHTIIILKLSVANNGNKKESKILLTLILTIVGAFLFIVILYLLNSKINAFIFTSAFLFFPIPFLLYATFKSAFKIPLRAYKIWLFKPDENVQIMESEQNLLLQFRIYKTTGRERLSTFTIRAPLEQSFGELFQDFIVYYNQSYPDKSIEHLVEDDQQKKLGWFFYAVNSWWPNRRILDPECTVEENRLFQKQKIYAKRVYL